MTLWSPRPDHDTKFRAEDGGTRRTLLHDRKDNRSDGGARKMTSRFFKPAATLVGVVMLAGTAACSSPVPPILQAAQAGERLPGAEKITFRSRVLDEERTVLVRVPEGYESSPRRYPVLYVMDAEYLFPQATAAVQFLSELGYLGGQHPIPEMIVVGVVNVDRDRDYTPTHAPEQSQGRLSFPTSGGAAAFQEFLVQELFPLVESRYRTHPHRVLSGWSLGGLFTVHTYLEQPELFSRFLAISPSLWWDDSVAVRETRQRLDDGGVLSPKPLVITLGTLEGGDMDGSVRKLFAPLLVKKGPPDLDFTFLSIPGEGHYQVPYKAYYDGLRTLYGDWVVPNEILGEGFQAVEGFFEDLSGRFGYPVDIPLSVYRFLSTTLPDLESALEVARLAAREYPNSSVAHLSLGRLQQMAGDRDGARESLEKALELELERPVPQSEWLRAIRGRLGP